MPEFRRGASAIAQAAADAKNKQGGFQPFAPSIFWQNDGDEKFLLFLNPLDEIPQVEAIGFIPVDRKKGDGSKWTSYETVIARTDPAIGEDEDAMVEQWDAKPKDTNIAVAVELEPEFEEIKGRKRAVGFKVKTREFERKIRDDNGDVTDDYETVVSPVVGFVQGSPHTLFQSVSAHDQEMPLEAWPVKIKKIGSGTTQSFNVTGFEDTPVDLEDLLLVDGISYLDEDEQDKILESAPGDDSTDDEWEEGLRAFALELGAVMLDKRLEELVDEDRYNKLLKGIKSSLDKFGKPKGGAKKSSARSSSPRATRRPARSKAKDPDPVEEDATEADEAPEEAPEEKPKRTRAPRKTAAKQEPKEEAPADDPEPADEPAEEKPAPARSGRSTTDRLAELKARAAKKKASTEE